MNGMFRLFAHISVPGHHKQASKKIRGSRKARAKKSVLAEVSCIRYMCKSFRKIRLRSKVFGIAP
jgi:hypothetical protein